MKSDKQNNSTNNHLRIEYYIIFKYHLNTLEFEQITPNPKG